MAVYYRFKSSTVSESISIDGSFVGVGALKSLIIEKKFGKNGGTRRNQSDLLLQNASTMEAYVDEFALIPKNTSVVVSCVPLQRQLPIIVGEGSNLQSQEQPSSEEEESCFISDGFYDFGDDPLSIRQGTEPTVQSSDSKSRSSCDVDAKENEKIRNMIKSSTSEWNFQLQSSFTATRSYVGRSTIIPQGYVCHICNVAGHLIQHCPTNGDPRYDKKRLLLPPNEPAFVKQVQVISSSSSSRTSIELPPELHCPLCKQVMRDAVLTSKCCFSTFCDECIRSHIISKSMCACGAAYILAEHLLPNMTVRDTISRLLASKSCSTENTGSVSRNQEALSSHSDQIKTEPSPEKDATDLEKADKAEKIGDEEKEDVGESSVLHVAEKFTQKLPVAVNETEQQAKTYQNNAAVSSHFAMAFGHSQYYPYWGGSYTNTIAMPYIGCGTGQGYFIPTVPIKKKCDFEREGENDKSGKCDTQLRKSVNDAAVKSSSGALLAGKNCVNNNVTSGQMKQPREVIPREGKSRTYHCDYERIHEPDYTNKQSRVRRESVSYNHHDRKNVDIDYKHRPSVSCRLRIQETHGPRRLLRDANPIISHHKNRASQRGYYDAVEAGYKYKQNVPCRESLPDKRKAPSSSRIAETRVMLMESNSSDDEEEKHFKRRRRPRYQPEALGSLVCE